MLKVGFLGSSSLDGFETYKQDLKEIIEFLFDCDRNLMIVSGGYQGLMEEVCKLAIQIKDERNLLTTEKYQLNILGILFDGYQNDPQNLNNDYTINKPNLYSDLIISSSTIGERVQNLVSLPDIIIALPGRAGTLHEILHFIEDAKYGRKYDTSEFGKLLIHPYWKEDVFQYLRDKNILIKENYNYLKFWSNKLKVKAHRKEYIIEIVNGKIRTDDESIEEVEKTEISDKPPVYYFDIQSKNAGESVIPGKAEFEKLINNFNQLFKGKYSEFKKINYLIGLDIVILDTKEKNLVELTTIGTQKYIDILGNFLDTKESILLNEEVLKNNFNKIKCINIENLNSQKNSNELKYYKFPENKYTPTSKSTFIDWVICLRENQLGKSIAWLTKPALENRYIISAFVSFEIFIPKLLEKQLENILTGFLYNQTLTNLHDRLTVELSKQATRAAISQVMARNTSHNIGAHVMNKLIGDNLGDVDIMKFENYDMDLVLSDDDKKIFKQIAIFNNYVKCRMDYLADISFGTPLMQTNKYVYQDIFKELDKVRLLLEYISGLSGFKYKIEFKRNGKSFEDANDLLVAIPNDILGTQAFYNILENIIRNTAKHSQNKEEITIFTVNFIDDINGTEYKDSENEKEIAHILSEFIVVEVYDNSDVKYDQNTKDESMQRQKMEYRDFTGNELSKKIDWLVFSQNWKLNEDILQDNKLRSSSLGLIEMDASAAYLRKRDVSFINHPSYQLNYNSSWSRLNTGKNCRYFLKAFNKEEDGKNYLGYRFFLHRPAVVLAVTNTQPENIYELKKQGIWAITPDDFKTYLLKGKIANHDFVLYTEIGNNELKISELVEEYKTNLPIRNLQVSDKDMKTFLSKKSLDEFEIFCWKKWNDEKYIKPDIDIVNSFDKACNSVFQAVFLDHLYSKEGNVKDRIEVNAEWEKHRDANYVEALSSLAQSKMPDFYKLTNSSGCQEHISTEKFKNCYLGSLSELAKHKIKEAVLAKVIVIDERIQETAENTNFMGVSYKKLYAKMNVVIPDKRIINLSENSFSSDFVDKTIKPFISEQIKDAKGTDFILIHYSILERMFRNEDINIYIEKELANNEINVVITSGRGIPDKLSEKVRFVNLSSVITSLIDIRSKYAINYLLNSTRKSNKI